MSSQGITYNASDAWQVRRLAVEHSIVKHRISLVNEVYYSTDQDDRSRENNAGAKKVAYDGLDPLIAPTI